MTGVQYLLANRAIGRIVVGWEIVVLGRSARLQSGANDGTVLLVKVGLGGIALNDQGQKHEGNKEPMPSGRVLD